MSQVRTNVGASSIMRLVACLVAVGAIATVGLALGNRTAEPRYLTMAEEMAPEQVGDWSRIASIHTSEKKKADSSASVTAEIAKCHWLEAKYPIGSTFHLYSYGQHSIRVSSSSGQTRGLVFNNMDSIYQGGGFDPTGRHSTSLRLPGGAQAAVFVQEWSYFAEEAAEPSSGGTRAELFLELFYDGTSCSTDRLKEKSKTTLGEMAGAPRPTVTIYLFTDLIGSTDEDRAAAMERLTGFAEGFLPAAEELLAAHKAGQSNP